LRRKKRRRIVSALRRTVFVLCFACAGAAPASMRVFSVGSPWNVPIGPSSTFVVTEPNVSRTYTGLSTWLLPDTTSVPIYTASAADPLQSVLYNANAWNNVANRMWLRSGNSAAVEAQILATSKDVFPSPGNIYSSQSAGAWVLPSYYDKLVNPANPPARVRLPSGARPAAGTDGPLVAFQPDGTVFEAYAAIVLSTGQVVALQYHLTDARGDGSGYANGTAASMLPIYAGNIRESELLAGSINHAMQILAPASLLDTQFVLPALAFDRGALTETPPYSGHLPMGARLAIPPSVDLGSLKLTTAVGKMIAQAAQKYGFIVANRGGSGITILVEASATALGVNKYDTNTNRDIQTIMTAVKTVR